MVLQAAAAGGPSDRVGQELAASKNREVDRILNFGGGSDGDAGSGTYRGGGGGVASAASEASASITLDDRSKVVGWVVYCGEQWCSGGMARQPANLQAVSAPPARRAV